MISINRIRTAMTPSIAFNVCALLLFAAGLYIHRGAIIKRTRPYFQQPIVPGTYTAKPDSTHFLGKEEYINSTGSKTDIRILVLGNSVSLHGVVPGIWAHESGMAASDKSKDYVHLLMQKISTEKKVGINFEVINIAEFERTFNSFNLSRFSDLRSKSPQYVIFQIGENIPSEEFPLVSDQFKQKYAGLVNYFDSATRIICLPFRPDMNKVYAITDVGVQTGSFIVDLSHLGNGLDERNLAGKENTYNVPGVAVHPGDVGMENIAKNLYCVFNATLANSMN